MGYHRHHAIIVTSWDDKAINAAHEKAIEIFERPITEITEPVMNGFKSFLIAPDGSKEWWGTSDEYDEKRKEYMQWAQKAWYELNLWIDAVEVCFGGDEPESNTCIVGHNREDEDHDQEKQESEGSDG